MAGIRYKDKIFSGAASFGSANDVSYDNTTSGLTATNVQAAVDELNSNKAENNISGTNYCKMPDGTLIQWGLAGAYKESSRADTDVTMPHSFVGNYYIYITSSFYSDATNYEVLCTAVPKTANIITVHQKNINANQNQVYYFYWLAIGRWKS